MKVCVDSLLQKLLGRELSTTLIQLGTVHLSLLEEPQPSQGRDLMGSSSHQKRIV